MLSFGGDQSNDEYFSILDFPRLSIVAVSTSDQFVIMSARAVVCQHLYQTSRRRHRSILLPPSGLQPAASPQDKDLLSRLAAQDHHLARQVSTTKTR